ncbi:MAG: hypothetical protein AAF809_12725 [Bacteroidota bacterium]
MAKHWKEPYTLEAAQALGIHDFEGCPVLGDANTRWIYYVRVCSFTFGFFSLRELDRYIDFFSHKTLPSSMIEGPFSSGPAASVGDGQSVFERLPGRLRAGGNRDTVHRALERARSDFAKRMI